ncbi:MAG: tetratricopeptide repeat protein [Lysobacteraceae bacterium]|nr:MAG: tetratricopeptide repeat protein [Xanthomonadaceae bacterium]
MLAFRSFRVLCLFAGLALADSAAWAESPANGAEDGPMAATLAGEYALQAGKLDEAARWYLDAAKAADGDADLAERAARIALLAKDDVRARMALSLWRARAEVSPAMRGAEASLALRRKDEGAARRELKALLREPGDADADDAGWRYALAALDVGSGDPRLTGRMLAYLVDSGAIPEALIPWLAFGEFAQQLQRKDLTEKIVAQVIRRFPKEPAAGLLQVSQLRDAGKSDQARQVLGELEIIAESRPELSLSIAREYSALGDHAKAASVLARGPQNDRIYSIRAAFLAQAEDKQGIGQLYDELKRDSSSPDPTRRLMLGQIAEYIERHAEALDWYAGVPGGPQRWQARLRSAPVLHKLKRPSEAYAQLRELQSDATVDDETRRDAYLLEAELRKDDKDPAAELDAYARGLAAFPDEPELLYGRALMWERRDDIPRAEADLRKILVADADDVNALNALGYTLADRTDRYQEALELIARAIAAEPDNAAIIDSYGWVLYRLGRNREALVELRRAFTKQKDAEIAAHLAEVLWMLGNKDEARKYFDESRKLDPENRSLKRALEKTGVLLPPAIKGKDKGPESE